MNNNLTKILITVATTIFIIFILGLIWLASIKQQTIAGGTFGFMSLLSFTSGLSMIVLPCTLPLVFIIVPLAMSKDYAKGLIMALLFGLGLSLTITFYGIAMAYLGEILGIKAATPLLLIVAGLAGYIFGLSQFNLFKIRLPFFASIMPEKLQQKGDYIKSFFLGLLLGNAGIGCPNPLFYVLLFYIAGTANIASGALLGFIHGIGRALPIILLTILAMFGFQSTKALIEYRLSIASISAWLLILIGAFLIPAGIFNLRGWWIIDVPIHWAAISLSIA
ncbi:MAG TPA: cytochrome c biogenesis protein CcdA, partial [Puia sp.]|nr:cytochrome c biogenesis protein CcdA [Puia sp.]